MPQGFAKAYSKGTQTVLGYSEYAPEVLGVLTAGYSEYSQGILRVLTHLGLPVGCACGGVPITCRETRAPPPGVPSCKPRWVSFQSTPVCTQGTPLSTQSTPLKHSQYLRACAAARRCRAAWATCVRKQTHEPKNRCSKCGRADAVTDIYISIYRYIDTYMYYTHTYANPPAANERSPERFLRINRTLTKPETRNPKLFSR